VGTISFLEWEPAHMDVKTAVYTNDPLTLNVMYRVIEKDGRDLKPL